MKNKKIITLILDIYLGWSGYHLFKQKRYGAALLWLFTLGYIGIGWIALIVKDVSSLTHKTEQLNGYSRVRLLESTTSELEKIDSMDGFSFEQYSADLLRGNGFYDVSVTQSSGDYGVDILASKDGIVYAVQCKCYSNPVGNKAVQEVYSGANFYGASVGAVLTNSTFTQSAIETATRNGVLLWDRTHLISLLENSIYRGERYEL